MYFITRPIFQAGLQVGDMILAVNLDSLLGRTYDEVHIFYIRSFKMRDLPANLDVNHLSKLHYITFNFFFSGDGVTEESGGRR